MKKTTLLAISVAVLLTACGESTEEKQQKIIAQQQQQLREQQNELQVQQQVQQQVQAQQQAQPQYAPQPQIIQQPASAPVVVQSAPQHDNTLMNLATGALIGHALTSGMSGGNDRTVERVVEHKTVIVNNHPEPTSGIGHTTPTAPTTALAPAPIAPVHPVAPIAPVAPKSSAMDMNKLSQSAKYSPPVSRPATVTPSVSRPSSSMNMSRLSSSGKR